MNRCNGVKIMKMNGYNGLRTTTMNRCDGLRSMTMKWCNGVRTVTLNICNGPRTVKMNGCNIVRIMKMVPTKIPFLLHFCCLYLHQFNALWRPGQLVLQSDWLTVGEYLPPLAPTPLPFLGLFLWFKLSLLITVVTKLLITLPRAQSAWAARFPLERRIPSRDVDSEELLSHHPPITELFLQRHPVASPIRSGSKIG